MEENNVRTPNERFKNACESLGLTQDKIAEIINVSQKTVSNYLAARTEPSEEVISILENLVENPGASHESLLRDFLRQPKAPYRLEQLDNLLWTIGRDLPHTRAFVMEMLRYSDKMKKLLNSQGQGEKGADTVEKQQSSVDSYQG